MGRPSVKAERREQILAATARCVARYGLAGLTLEKVSEESGMSRGHVRHYVGNRDDLILALVQWELGKDDELTGATGPERSLELMMGYLYGAPFSAPTDDNSVILELLNAARTNGAIRKAMLDGYTGLRTEIHAILVATYPDSDPADLWERAYALLALAIGNAAMSDLDPSTNADPVVRAAGRRMLDTLTPRSVDRRG